MAAFRRAEIERIASANSHCVDELAVDELCADDRLIAADKLRLEEQQVIGPKQIAFRAQQRHQVLVAAGPADVRAASPAIRLEQGGEWKPPRKSGNPPDAVEHDGGRSGHPQPPQEQKLSDLAGLHRKGHRPVDHAASMGLKDLHEGTGAGDRRPVPAQIGAGTDPVENHTK